MSLVTIRQKIKDKLDARKGVGQPLVEVFQEHRAGFSGYPSATFEPSDVMNDFETNVENRRRYVFRIVLHQEMEHLGRDGAIGVLCSLIDTLLQDFDTDWDLGNSVNFCQATPSVWGVYDEGAGKVMYAELKVEAIKVTNVQ